MSLHHRGGARPNAGRKSGWSTSDTQTIRVPKKLSEQLIEIAKKLDSGNEIEFETNSISPALDKLEKVISKWLEKRKMISRNTGKWNTAHKILDELEAILNEKIDVPQEQMNLLENQIEFVTNSKNTVQ
jgi:hypothetical protein